MPRKKPQPPQTADQNNPPVEVRPEVTMTVASESPKVDAPKPKKTETIYGLKVESF